MGVRYQEINTQLSEKFENRIAIHRWRACSISDAISGRIRHLLGLAAGHKPGSNELRNAKCTRANGAASMQSIATGRAPRGVLAYAHVHPAIAPDQAAPEWAWYLSSQSARAG